jgi:hypothetical protein
MRITICLVAALMLQQPNGCDQSKTAAPAPPPKPPPYQRFLPIPGQGFFMAGVPWNGYFALDTKTGILCLTVADFIPKDFPNTPTCLKLMSEWPDTPNIIVTPEDMKR